MCLSSLALNPCQPLKSLVQLSLTNGEAVSFLSCFFLLFVLFIQLLFKKLTFNNRGAQSRLQEGHHILWELETLEIGHKPLRHKPPSDCWSLGRNWLFNLFNNPVLSCFLQFYLKHLVLVVVRDRGPDCIDLKQESFCFLFPTGHFIY